MVPTQEVIGSMIAARLFGMTRAGFYKFAERRGIQNVIPYNAAKTRQERAYAFKDIATAYREVYGEELTVEEVERLRREAQGAPGGE